jgi:hypothetical protein
MHSSQLRRSCGLSRLKHDPNPVADGATGAYGIGRINGCDADGQGKHRHDADADYPRDCHVSLPLAQKHYSDF